MDTAVPIKRKWKKQYAGDHGTAPFRSPLIDGEEVEEISSVRTASSVRVSHQKTVSSWVEEHEADGHPRWSSSCWYPGNVPPLAHGQQAYDFLLSLSVE